MVKRKKKNEPHPALPGSAAGRWVPVCLLCLLIPVMLGGCPEFRDNAVSAVDSFTRSMINSVLDLFFDLFRSSPN